MGTGKGKRAPSARYVQYEGLGQWNAGRFLFSIYEHDARPPPSTDFYQKLITVQQELLILEQFGTGQDVETWKRQIQQDQQSIRTDLERGCSNEA